MSMEQPKVSSRSHLFTVRVWEEEIGADQTEWRGKVQLVSSGEVRYFRDWEALVPLLATMLSELDTSSTAPPSGERTCRSSSTSANAQQKRKRNQP